MICHAQEWYDIFYIYIYFRKLRIYAICVFRVSQERVQTK